jgi:hypothetical protein
MKTSHKSDELKFVRKGGSTNPVPMIKTTFISIQHVQAYTADPKSAAPIKEFPGAYTPSN